MQQTQQEWNKERSERREAAQATSKRARRQAARRARLTHRRRAKAQPLPRPTERHPHRARTFSHARRADKSEGARRARVRARWWVVAEWVVHRFSSYTLARGVTQARTAPRHGVSHKGSAKWHTAGAPTATDGRRNIYQGGEKRNDNICYVHR